MKLLYLVFGGQQQGVKKKILDKTSFIRKAGIHVSVLFVVDKEDDNSYATDGTYDVLEIDSTLARCFSGLPFLWRTSILLTQRGTYAAVSAYLEQNDYDLILMRYPVSDLFLYRFMKRHSCHCRVIFEHNSIEENELRLRSHHSYWYKYFYWNEKWFGRAVRMRASALISVTREIQEWQSHLVGGEIPSVTISNGIDVSRIKSKALKTDERKEVINLLFLAGSEAPWHGVDILLNSLEAYDGPQSVHCYVVGRIEPLLADRARLMKNVTLLGHQSDSDLDLLAEICDIGIGSLALFRNNMAEGCTLKVREYWARGLPFVIGYRDTDLMENQEMEAYFLKVHIADGRYGLAFDVDSVLSFCKTVYKIPSLHSTMRALAAKTIDYPIKVEGYFSFFNSVMGSRKALKREDSETVEHLTRQ